MKLLLLIFMLQICHIYCNDKETKLIRYTIKKTFGYDCELRPKIKEIMFWKISIQQNVSRRINLWDVLRISKKFKLQIYIPGITRFHSNETYLILTKVAQTNAHIFSWVGSQATLDDKKKVAKYNLQHYSQLNDYYELTNAPVFLSIHREREAVESELFKHIIVAPRGEFDMYHFRIGLLSIYPNMYVVRGVGNITCIKKVPLSTLWLKNDTCIVLETGYSMDRYLTVFFYCGIRASVPTCNRASHFATSLHVQYNTYLHNHFQNVDNITLLKDTPRLKSFIELLEDQSYYKPNQFDDSNDHLKDSETFIQDCNARISLIKIFRGPISNTDDQSYVTLDGNLRKQVITQRPISCAIFKHLSASYILNTDSISGCFVRLGLCTLDVAVKTMQYAEEYVHSIESGKSRPIYLRIDGARYPNYTYFSINLAINLIDYPPPLGSV